MLPEAPPVADRLRTSVLFGSLPDEAAAALAAEAEARAFDAGAVVFEEGGGHFALVVVEEGRLEAVERDGAGSARVIRTVGPGEAVNELQVLAGREHPAAVRAAEATRALVVPGAAIDRLARAHPALREALERLQRRQLLCRLHAVLGPFDRAFLDEVEAMADWVSLRRGAFLEADGEGGLYLVVSGRVQALRPEAGGRLAVVAEAGRGETMGELTFFREAPGGQRLRAVRDSALVAFTPEEFERLVARRPAILRQVARLLTERPKRASRYRRPGGRVTNVAVVPAREDAPVAELAGRLLRALAAFGPVLRLTAEAVDRLADEAGLAQAEEGSAAEPALLAWLDAQEVAHRFVVYEADAADTPWTRRCLRMADRALVVARAGGDPAPSALERALFAGEDPGAHETLVLVHPDGERLPEGTRAWLAARPTFEDHVHLRWDREADVERLARMLAGRAVGVVLGGGGARGFAHIGVLRAMDEAGVPVDAVGGTSMGAALAAQRAMGWDADRLAAANRRVFVELRPHKRYTLPVTSLVTNRLAEECGRWLYGEADVEDLWLPFFCVSSNLTTAEMVVHRSGSVRKATLASASIPAFAPPIVEGTHLLCDGALLNNVPADVMRELGCGTVIASEVSVEDDAVFQAERVPTAWEVVRGRFGRARGVRFPSMLELGMRATLLHSTQREKRALEDADFCFHPPIDAFSLMDFPRLDEIVGAGYDYAREALQAWEGRPGAPAAAPAAPAEAVA